MRQAIWLNALTDEINQWSPIFFCCLVSFFNFFNGPIKGCHTFSPTWLPDNSTSFFPLPKARQQPRQKSPPFVVTLVKPTTLPRFKSVLIIHTPQTKINLPLYNPCLKGTQHQTVSLLFFCCSVNLVQRLQVLLVLTKLCMFCYQKTEHADHCNMFIKVNLVQ